MRPTHVKYLPHVKRLLQTGLVLAVLAGCVSHTVADYSIAQAVAAPDDTKVVVTGEVVQQVDRGHILLRDSTGQINVQIDDEILGKVKFAPDAEVRVMGRVDRDSQRSLLIAQSVEVVR